MKKDGNGAVIHGDTKNSYTKYWLDRGLTTMYEKVKSKNITINSSWRSPYVNRAYTANAASKHVRGAALDFYPGNGAQGKKELWNFLTTAFSDSRYVLLLEKGTVELKTKNGWEQISTTTTSSSQDAHNENLIKRINKIEENNENSGTTRYWNYIFTTSTNQIVDRVTYRPNMELGYQRASHYHVQDNQLGK